MSRMVVVLWACLLVVATLAADGAGNLIPVVSFPGDAGPLRLGFDVTREGQPPHLAWEAFLDRLVAWFDRDGDGVLAATEIARKFPLPLPGKQVLTLDFARIDRDGNGKATPAELKEFCRANGFGPVAIVVTPATEEDHRLARLLMGRLDVNGDGRLSRPEVQRAPELLQRFDLNEDEALDRIELLASASAGQRRVDQTAIRTDGGTADVVMRLDLGKEAATPVLVGKTPSVITLMLAPQADGPHRLQGPGRRWLAVVLTTYRLIDLTSAQAFALAQLNAALGNRAAVPIADVDSDPALGGLRALAPYADRNGDGELSADELSGYFSLIGFGLRAQTWIKVAEHGHNLLPALDVDGNGRLSYEEMALAVKTLFGDAVESVVLPAQIQITFGGPDVAAWGGVKLPAPVPVKQPSPSVSKATPRWFQAMDRNRDNLISPREFIGGLEAFRRLDTDKDGMISPAEAQSIAA